MATASLLRQLIKTGAEGDHDAFKRASERLIQEERAKNHHLLANDLEKILYGRKSPTTPLNSMLDKHIPFDRERKLPLAQIKEPRRRMEDLVLSEENASIINEIMQEHNRAELLGSYGLFPADKILFCGPPGCGKTLTAEVLAGELNLPLAIVRTDSVISSFLGETASNLRQLFDFISTISMVVLFDEFDALAKERAEKSEHGELKRVVNAFLQMLDDYDGKSILVAATNHEQTLDSAIWRRFDEVLVFEKPNAEQLLKLLSIKLCGLRRNFEIEDAGIVSLFDGMSHADIERVVRRAAKDMVLSGMKCLDERHLRISIHREKSRNARCTSS